MATITDSLGRSVDVETAGGLDTYTFGGVSVSFETGYPQAQALATIEGMASVPPVVAPTYTFLQFLALFTSGEQVAIASSTDPKVRIFTLMAASSAISLSNPLVAEGVDYCVSIGILTSGRATAILAGQTP
jgi:hypothetical protein